MLDIIKIALNINNNVQDDYLRSLVKMTQEEILSYTNNPQIPEYLIIEVVIYKYYSLRNQGINSENYTGVSYSYTNDYPENVVRELKRYRKVKTL